MLSLMKMTLTDKKKKELECSHESTRDGRLRDRIKAVLLASEGWSSSMISQALRIHETTVLRHLKDFEQSEKLKPENGGSNSHLSVAQTMALTEHLSTHLYHHAHQIVAYVKEEFDIHYTVSGMNKWLHYNGFSYKKPKDIPRKIDEQKQHDFIHHYDALKETTSDPILFLDAVHPTQATKISYGWIRKGENRAIVTTGSRSRMNLIGALALDDIGNTVIEHYDRINSESIVRFFWWLKKEGHYPLEQNVHIVLDGAGYHRTELVPNAAKVLNIELHYLPPYSPNLNPIERLWKVMNEQVRNNVYFANKREFEATIKRFFTEVLPILLCLELMTIFRSSNLHLQVERV